MMHSLFARLILSMTLLQLSLGNLDEYLNYYETLHHDNFRHQIKRRDLYTKNPIERIVEFESHGKHFKLMLHKNTSVLSSNFKLSVVVDGREKRSAEVIDSTIYRGYLADEPTTSSVSAYWDDDQHFTASISMESDIFVVEPSWRHLPESPDYTLISYKGSDIKQNEKSTNEFCEVGSNSAVGGKASDIDKRLDDEPHLLHKVRTKRSSPCPKLLNKTCPVLLVADFRFYRKVGKKDVTSTFKYMVYVMDQVDQLFRNHVFGDCGGGFGFVIKDIVVNQSPSNSGYNSDRAWYDSTELLESFSRGGDKKNYSDFCLVHLFTAVSFSSGVLGISIPAMPSKIPNDGGGVCFRPNRSETSKNTGWTTFLDRNNKNVLAVQALLVVAHEFGHSWGSYHDPENSTKNCIPSYSKGGKFLMFVNSVTGNEPNNRFFSNCSITAIRDVLVNRTFCFTSKGESLLCGNYIKEKGEECDEGPGSEHNCCTSCRLRTGAECSDFNDACCENCKIADANKICAEASVETCMEQTNCTGYSSSCPNSTAKPDGVECEKQGVCSNKTCISVCKYNNKTQCSCDSVENSCRICCRDSMSENDTCKPYRLSNETADFGNVSDNTPCLIGLCSNGVCLKVTDVTIQRTWKFIEIRSVAQFVKFMKDNIVGTVIILSLLFWIPASCAVSHIDRKRANQDLEGINWLSITNNLLVPQLEQNGAKIMKTAGTLERTSFRRQAGHYEKGRQYKQ